MENNIGNNTGKAVQIMDDDQMDDFPIEDWEEVMQDAEDTSLWDTNWDTNEALLNDEFTLQLRAELAKETK